jgi:NTP pyrophosphatase (non-canonical NTP hydrolase)
MTFDDYQRESADTAVYPSALFRIYPTLGLCGESGEIAEKVKKLYRDRKGDVPSQRWLDDLEQEVGDVLWYLAAICRDFGISMDDAAQWNLSKLKSRKERNVLSGSGDNR